MSGYRRARRFVRSFACGTGRATTSRPEREPKLPAAGGTASGKRRWRRGEPPAGSVDDRQTPPELFDPLHARFRSRSTCALPHNAKLPRYFTPEQDGLAQDWAGERVWCNPPYSNIEPWVAKARQHEADLVVMLVPANRTEQGWWQRHIEPTRDRGELLRVKFLAGRQRFIAHDADGIRPNERPPYGVALLILGTRHG
jgi:phage N-6-adenine-methyltransferase